MHHKHVGVGLAYYAVVAFDFVTAAIYFEVDVAPYQAFDVGLGGIDCYGFFHTMIIDKKYSDYPRNEYSAGCFKERKKT